MNRRIPPPSAAYRDYRRDADIVSLSWAVGRAERRRLRRARWVRRLRLAVWLAGVAALWWMTHR